MLTTVEAVIDKLGGPKDVAKMFNVGVTAVLNVKARNRIPYRWRMRIFQEAEQRGIAIAPELIGRDEGEAA